MGDLFSNMSEPAYKKDAHISYHQGGQNGKGLRGGNIGEEPFFFEGDGAFISGDLVKPELYLRKNYMIAPAVSSPDRIGKNALIDRDYSDVFTACSSSSFAESRNPITAFPLSVLTAAVFFHRSVSANGILGGMLVPLLQNLHRLAGGEACAVFAGFVRCPLPGNTVGYNGQYGGAAHLMQIAYDEVPGGIRVDIGHSGLPQIFNQVLGTRRPETIFTDFAPLPDVE